MGIAPLVAGWKMRRPWPGAVLAGPSQGGQGPAGFPAAALELHVELYLGGSWVDITSDVRYADESAIGIERSARVHARSAASFNVTMTLNNRDGRYSPRNPTGPYYGQLGQNTPIRVAVRADYRFHGEVSALPQKWDKTGNDAWVPLQANGILWRLNSPGAKPLRSSIWRVTNRAGPIAHWPLEDATAATQFASSVAGVSPMTISGTVEPAAVDTLVGSAPLPQLGSDARLIGTVPAYTATSEWVVSGFFYLTTDVTSTQTIVEVRTSGTARTWKLIATSGSPDTMYLRAYDSSGVEIAPALSVVPVEYSYDTWYAFDIRISDLGGGDVSWILTLTSNTGFGTGHSNVVTTTVGVVTEVRIVATAQLADSSYGHIAVFDEAKLDYLTDLWRALIGWAGESAADRLARLCAEEGIAFQLLGTAADTAAMGPQQIATLLDLLQQAADADQGMLYEPRDALGIGYRTRTSLYNQPARVSLDYAASDLSEVPEPVGWDRVIENDVTAVRIDGSSARVTITEGPLSTQDPPDGVGTYDVSFEVNVETDEQLPDVAGWVAHVGTNDDATVEAASVGLHRSAVSGDVYLTANVTAADVGDVIVIDNPPVWLAADQVRLLVTGYRETLATFMRTITWRVTPAGPYDVGVLDSGSLGRLDTAGSELAEALDDSGTAVDVATTAGPLWTTNDAEFPFDVRVGGERMTVTDIAASLIVFGGVGAADHDVNAAVQPVLPSHAAGQLLVVYAAIRNSGAGIPQAPTNVEGWARLPIFTADANAQVFAKIAESSAETDPIVTFAGGVANADTSAQAIRLNGKWYDLNNIVLRAADSLNESAQDIAYPGLTVEADNSIVMYFGWKADDWTSVASPGTEFGEPATITGDDQGIVWSRQIQTTKANIAAGSFVVTGGIAAISRGAVAAIRCDAQEFTVTRSINGVVKSHAAGTDVRLWTPLVLAR